MSINPTAIAVPQPSTTRGISTHLSLDALNQRLAYCNGKSIIIRPIDFNSNQPVIVFNKHLFTTTAVKFSPSGYYIASGDESGNVKIWDVSPTTNTIFDQPIIKSEFQIISGPIKSIAWDNDSQRIIAVGDGKEKFGHAFSWDTGNSIGDIQGHSSSINSVDIKLQRPIRAATVSDDYAMIFYTGPPFKFDKSLRGNHSNIIRDVKFSPNGEYLVSVGSDRIICLYNGKTGEFIKKNENSHDGGIFAVSWTTDSEYFITASADNTLKKWSINGENVKTIKVSETISPLNQQVGLALAKDFIISLSVNGSLNYFNYDGELVKIVSGHQSSITKIEINNNKLISGDSNGKLYEWEIKDEKLNSIPILKGEHKNYISDILTIGYITYTIGWDDVLKSWKNNELIQSITLNAQPKQIISYEDKLIILFESKIELYSNDLKLLTDYKFPFSSTNIALLNNSLLITNNSQNTIEEFKIVENEITFTKSFPKMRSPPTLIRVSPNMEYFAVGDSTGKYTLYNQNGDVITTRWAFHTSKIFDAKWAKDSKYLISGGLDDGLFLYSVDKPSKVVKFPLAHSGTGISGIEWIGDNKFITSGLDGTIRTWELA
ncbi:unnamed protein product [Candida verbasci]|uniref:Actin-interacting protein 1 n=1 Tax=Candida verbasci TaxID=1227364 RepID=A0A9W4TRH2_9ASCO|nr:unnamed protein product [Candida verbasci]